jgi:peptidoglycan L-alanyl-D-glutamate endopeptidase CwlK
MPNLPTLRLGSQGPYVKKLKMNLNGLAKNYNNFIINNYFDQKTEAVLKNYQDDVRIPRNGVVGSATWASLINGVKMIQLKLNSLGYNSGTPDGWYGKITTEAVLRFQGDHTLVQDGVVNPRTRISLFVPHSADEFESRASSTSLSSLDPHVAMLANELLKLSRAHNLDVRITTGFRNWAESDRLYAQGRTMPGPVVSNARAGDSYHNWGLAFDIAPFENNQISNDQSKYIFIGHLGEQIGLEWGGTFKSIVDLPHYQYTFGLTTEDLQMGKRPAK